MPGLRDTKLLESGDFYYAGGQAGQQHWMGDGDDHPHAGTDMPL